MFPLAFQQAQVSAPRTVSFIDRTIDSVPSGHALIRVRASAICGSDLHIFRGLHPSAPLPVTIGHEFSGDVVAVGTGVDEEWLGARVTVEPCLPCGQCDACQRGQYGHCESLSFFYRSGGGAMAPYATVPVRCLYRLPEMLSYHAGALIEPLAVAVHAVKRSGIRLGDSALVVGAGAVGLFVGALAAHAGAHPVVAVDPLAVRRDMAIRMGFTAAVAPEEAIPHEGCFTHAFECVGRETTLTAAIEALAKGGLATILGIFERQPSRFPIGHVVTRELRLQGAQGYCWDFSLAVSLAKPLGIERLVTHRFPLCGLQAALEACESPSACVIKAVIEP